MDAALKSCLVRIGNWVILLALVILPVLPVAQADDEDSDERAYWTDVIDRVRENQEKAQADLARAQARVSEIEVRLQVPMYGDSCEIPCTAAEAACPELSASAVGSLVDEQVQAQTTCGRIFQAAQNTTVLSAACSRAVQGCGEVRDLRALASARAAVEMLENTLTRLARELSEARRERSRIRECEECSTRSRGSVWRNMFAGGGAGFGLYLNLGGGWGGMNSMMANPYMYGLGQLYNPYGGLGMYGMLPNVAAYLNPYMGMNSMMMNPMFMNMGFDPSAMYMQQVYMQQMYAIQLQQQQAYMNPMMFMNQGGFNPMFMNQGGYNPWMMNSGFNPMFMNQGGYNPWMMNAGFNPMFMNQVGYNPWMMNSGFNPMFMNQGGYNPMMMNGGYSAYAGGMYQQQMMMQMQMYQQQLRQQQDAQVAYQQMIEAQGRFQQTRFGGGLTGSFGLGGSFSGGRLF
jgi:hypothetical protein